MKLLSQTNYAVPHKPIYYFNYVLEGGKDGDWKLRIRKENDKVLQEMFNLGWDPTERVNLYNDPKYAKEQQHLLTLFDRYPDK